MWVCAEPEGAEALAVVPVAPVLELVHHEVDVHPGLVSTVPNPSESGREVHEVSPVFCFFGW